MDLLNSKQGVFISINNSAALLTAVLLLTLFAGNLSRRSISIPCIPKVLVLMIFLPFSLKRNYRIFLSFIML